MKKMTGKTTRRMNVTMKIFGEERDAIVMARCLEEGVGKAICLYGVREVVRVFDPYLGEVWTNHGDEALATANARVAELEAEKKASERRTIKLSYSWRLDRSRKGVTVPLTREQHDAVEDAVERSIGDTFGNGDMIAGSFDEGWGCYEDVVESEELLPPFVGFLVRCDYSREAGTSGYRIWGVLPLEEGER